MHDSLWYKVLGVQYGEEGGRLCFDWRGGSVWWENLKKIRMGAEFGDSSSGGVAFNSFPFTTITVVCPREHFPYWYNTSLWSIGNSEQQELLSLASNTLHNTPLQVKRKVTETHKLNIIL